jgi:hydrogenase large subunit
VSRIKGGDVTTFAGAKWDPSSWPKTTRGYGPLDAPRGALGHWVEISDGKIARYQCVVPTTWNASPRDDKGVVGPYEAALTDNHPLLKPEQPIEILRTVHSFDPCNACGVHVLDADGSTVTEVRVQ